MSAVRIARLNRAAFHTSEDLQRAVADHVAAGEMVNVEDRRWPFGRRLKYQLAPAGVAVRLLDGYGHHRGTYADPVAAVREGEFRTAMPAA